MKFNADTEIQDLIRPARRSKNLPKSCTDVCLCDDQDTNRQIRRSQNNYRNTIRKNND